jgi:RNA polymerase sigma-70 factor (ECF subfamily)
MGEQTDIQLVEKCLKGDDSAFEKLVERYQLPMYRTAAGIVDSPDQAKDVTQNGFIKAWKKLDSFNSDYRFFSWLYRIIINEALNHCRGNDKTVTLSSVVTNETTPHQKVVTAEETSQVKKAIQQLKPHYRTVIHLRHFEELSYKDIASVLDIEPKTVKSRLYTARSNLREIISDSK